MRVSPKAASGGSQDQGFKSVEVPKERSGTGDHKLGRVRESHQAHQPLAQEGGGQGLRSRPRHETGLHTGQEHPAHHAEVLQGTLMGRDLPIIFRGGFKDIF